LKRKISNKKWDLLSFEGMLKNDNSLDFIYTTLRGKEKSQWKRDILTRLNREKLLGKNMI